MVDSALVSFSRRNIFAESLNDSSMKPSLTQHETTSLAHIPRDAGPGPRARVIHRREKKKQQQQSFETHLKASPVQWKPAEEPAARTDIWRILLCARRRGDVTRHTHLNTPEHTSVRTTPRKSRLRGQTPDESCSAPHTWTHLSQNNPAEEAARLVPAGRLANRGDWI